MRKQSGNLIIANQSFHVDAPVINFREPPYWDATREVCQPTATNPNPQCKPGGVPYGNLPHPYTKRYALRAPLRRYGMNPPLEAVKAVIKQFVVHHDGCSSSDMCFSVLQNERGLSCHFLVDNDGTIYQTIDLALMAYHAAEWNTYSIGVEFCNRGDAKKEPNYYSSGKFGPKRNVKPVKINGNTILAFEYTAAQLDAFTALGKALTRLLPNIAVEYVQSSPGQAAMETIPTSASFSFSGYIGHYHLITQKWDPGPFDFKKFCSDLRGSFCFPVFPKPSPDRKPDDKPSVPEDSDALKEAATELYKQNQQRADGGFFPVGPWGETRLWHGGVHLAGKTNDPVFAPFPGRLVAARMGPSTPIGSTNFVLLKHDMTLGKSKVQFYSLYMHLADEKNAEKPLEWMQKSEAWKNAKPGNVALLDEPITAGTLIGHVGTAGPAEWSKAQVHVEFFSNSELFTDVPGSPWQFVDGTSGGRFCDVKTINDAIDTVDKDGTLSRQELSSFYSGATQNPLKYTVVLHVSEWTAEPSWADALRVPKDFKKLKPAEIDQLVADQIAPGLWWDSRVAAHARLPADGVVFHYHPVDFLAWFNQQLLDAKANATTGPSENDAQEVPKGITDDFGDINGSSMRSSADISEDPCNQKITLADLVQGFDAPECTP
jgi:N-acetyl-anhydromuramyl-L-alanine amidase AmpD